MGFKKESLEKRYQSFSLLFTTTILSILAINFVILFSFKAKRAVFPPQDFNPNLSDKFTASGAPVPNGKRSPYQTSMIDRSAYGDYATDKEIGEMLDEFYDSGDSPHTYLGMGMINPPSFIGKHVRLLTDEVGVRYRWTPSADRIPQKNKKDLLVYIFGGSITVGTHVADKHTWPSYFDSFISEAYKDRNVVVRNYARNAFSLSLESLLFYYLLREGQHPDIVIFMDGGNAPRGIENNHFGHQELSKLVSEYYNPPLPKITDFPAVKNSGFSLLAQWIKRGTGRNLASTKPPKISGELVDIETEAREMARTYLTLKKNIQAIARANQIRTFFFLAPDAVYNYPRHLYRQIPGYFWKNGPKIKDSYYEILRKETDSVYLGNLFQKWGDRKALVDGSHYSPAFSEFLAKEVASNLLKHPIPE